MINLLYLKRKGQLSFDYIAGFATFMVAVIYIINMMITTVPANFRVTERNDMKQIAWTTSEIFINNIEKNSYELDENIINHFYTYYISQDKKMDALSKVEFNVFPVIITDRTSKSGRDGTLTFDKSSANPIEVTFTLNNNQLNSTENPELKEEGQKIKIGSKIYTIKKIDENSNFAVLQYNPQGISTGIDNLNKYVIIRYSTYDGFITEVRAEYIDR